MTCDSLQPFAVEGVGNASPAGAPCEALPVVARVVAMSFEAHVAASKGKLRPFVLPPALAAVRAGQRRRVPAVRRRRRQLARADRDVVQR